jgi:hypothetical protein
MYSSRATHKAMVLTKPTKHTEQYISHEAVHSHQLCVRAASAGQSHTIPRKTYDEDNHNAATPNNNEKAFNCTASSNIDARFSNTFRGKRNAPASSSSVGIWWQETRHTARNEMRDEGHANSNQNNNKLQNNFREPMSVALACDSPCPMQPHANHNRPDRSCFMKNKQTNKQTRKSSELPEKDQIKSARPSAQISDAGCVV